MIAVHARHIGVQRFLISAAFACALLSYLPAARGAITFVAPAVTLPHSGQVQNGSFEVYISSTTLPEPSIGDFQFTLDLPNQQNATLTGGTATTSAAHPYLFDGDSSPKSQLSNNNDTITGTDFTLTSGGVSLFDGAGLMKVNYSIAPNFVGSFPLVFETSSSASSLNDGQGNALSISFINGSLSVVPEPSAAVLLAIGAICSCFLRICSVCRAQRSS
jgi:hypothetical protein